MLQCAVEVSSAPKASSRFALETPFATATKTSAPLTLKVVRSSFWHTRVLGKPVKVGVLAATAEMRTARRNVDFMLSNKAPI